MVELKSIYLNPRLEKTYHYFSKVVQNGLPLDSTIRYSFKENAVKASVLEKTYESSSNSVVKFLFRIDKYETNILNRHTSFNKQSFNIKENIPKIKKGLQNDTFFIGCVLKQVKGGFTIDLGGLVCFMPYSLSEGTRFVPYAPQKNVTQLFQAHGLSLVATPEKEIFLNLIVSRKNNIKLLKGLIKNFFKKSGNNLKYSTLLKDVVKTPRTKSTRFRLVSSHIGYKGEKVNLIRMVKEAKYPYKKAARFYVGVY